MVLFKMQTYQEFLIESNLHEMANLDASDHGINDVIIWVGIAPEYHGLRIKVSNLKNKWSSKDNFTISIPDFQIRNGIPAKWLTDKIDDIIDWIKLNIDVIKDYETGKEQSTREFLLRIKKI